MSTTRRTSATGMPTVPAPVPADDPDAWYAPDVRSQAEVHPGVVVTVIKGPHGFVYDVREPGLTTGDRAALERVEAYIASTRLERPPNAGRCRI